MHETNLESEREGTGPLTASRSSETYGKKARKGNKWNRDARAASKLNKTAPPKNTKEVCKQKKFCNRHWLF